MYIFKIKLFGYVCRLEETGHTCVCKQQVNNNTYLRKYIIRGYMYMYRLDTCGVRLGGFRFQVEGCGRWDSHQSRAKIHDRP